MGDVYEVAHQRLAGRYAVKVLNADFASHADAFLRFRREAMVTSGLQHPGIVQVIDFDRTEEGFPYLVMEFLDGRELAEIITTSAPLPLPRVVALVEQLGAALSAAHRQGIVHRDLKPQNIFVLPLDGERELVKIVDFGISKAHAESQKLTGESSLLGTPQYMAPEQATGRSSDVDGRADQFALAAITYEMLAGEPPFSADSLMALVYQIVNVDPPPLAARAPGITGEVDAVVRRGLAKRPEERYPDVAALVAALVGASRGQRSLPSATAMAGAAAAGTPTIAANPAGSASTPRPGSPAHVRTTLSGGTGQAERPPPRTRWGGTAIFAMGAIAAAVTIIGLVRWSSRETPAPPPIVAPATPPVAAPSPVTLPPPPPSPAPEAPTSSSTAAAAGSDPEKPNRRVSKRPTRRQPAAAEKPAQAAPAPVRVRREALVDDL